MTMPGDLLSGALIEVARDLREKRVTARELIEAAIARHERFGQRLHAYSLWAPEQARAVAAAADAAFSAEVSVGPLQGLPVSIKDLFAASGYPCFAGSSRRLPADAWERDGPLVATLRRQLGVIMGKTHMVEFAFGGTGHNSHWGAPHNPWDASAHRAPGGSSSGAGVSLLEGSALLAFGSDTAGSVRIPASMTGTVGLKVTLGRWSTEGVVPLSPTFDTPGLLARSVADVAYGFAALDTAGIEPVGFVAREGTRDISGVRIGVGDPFLWRDCDAGITETVQEAVDALGQAGAARSGHCPGSAQRRDFERDRLPRPHCAASRIGAYGGSALRCRRRDRLADLVPDPAADVRSRGRRQSPPGQPPHRPQHRRGQLPRALRDHDAGGTRSRRDARRASIDRARRRRRASPCDRARGGARAGHRR